MTTWLARAEGWLLEPADPAPSALLASPEPPPPPPPARPAIAVVGLAPGCGATTLARALAVELALRDPAGVALVASGRHRAVPLPVATPASARLARSLRALGCDEARGLGHLCLVGESPLPVARPAPLVVDTGRECSFAVADRTLLVAGPRVEPSLAQVVRASFERFGREPALIANRVEEAGRWEALGALVVGESRLAAGLALAGREPRGRLGATMRALVENSEREGW